jgi:hypothetical protein
MASDLERGSNGGGAGGSGLSANSAEKNETASEEGLTSGDANVVSHMDAPPDVAAPADSTDEDRAGKLKEQVFDMSKKFGRALKDLGSKVARRSGDLVEEGKLEVEIMTLDKKARELEADLGRKVYNLWSMSRIQDKLILDLLKDEFEVLDEVDEKRHIAKELLTNLRYKPEDEKK